MFGSLFGRLKEAIINKYTASVIRHLMTALSGWLLAIGLEPELVGKFAEAGTTVAVAVAVYALTQFWSWLEKRNRATD